MLLSSYDVLYVCMREGHLHEVIDSTDASCFCYWSQHSLSFPTFKYQSHFLAFSIMCFSVNIKLSAISPQINDFQIKNYTILVTIRIALAFWYCRVYYIHNMKENVYFRFFFYTKCCWCLSLCTHIKYVLFEHTVISIIS